MVPLNFIKSTVYSDLEIWADTSQGKGEPSNQIKKIHWFIYVLPNVSYGIYDSPLNSLLTVYLSHRQLRL